MTNIYVILYMDIEKDLNYSSLIKDRLDLIMELAGLEINGFAEFINISESHLYAILNGRRKLTGGNAEQIGKKFGFEGWKILQLDYKIPLGIRRAPDLLEFYSNNKEIKEYFIETKDERKASYFVEFALLQTSVFDEPKYVWEIKEICLTAGRDYKSKDLSQHLMYLVKKEKLKREKRPLKRVDGSFTSLRTVYVFFK